MIITELEDENDLISDTALILQLQKLNKLPFEKKYDYYGILQLSLDGIKWDNLSDGVIYQVIDLIYNLVKPGGEWIWYRNELSDINRWKNQQKFVKAVPLLLKLLKGVVDLSDTSEKENDRIIEIISYYKPIGYPWSSESAYNVVCELELLIKVDVNQSSNYNQLEYSISYLIDTIRPLFSASHARVSAAGRQKSTNPVNSRFIINESDEYTKPWRLNQGCIAVLEYVMMRLRVGGELSRDLVKLHWPLFIPSILNIIDDHEPFIKTKGCLIGKLLFEVCDEKFFQQTGVGPIFWDALTPCLLYLPPSTSSDVSLILIPSCIESLLTLVEKNHDKEKRYKNLNEIIRDGIFKGISQCNQDINLLIMFQQQIIPIANALNVEIVRHLKQLIKIFVKILCDPFVTEKLIISTCDGLISVMNNGWPRIKYYKYDILLCVVKCWKNQMNNQMKNNEISDALRNVIYKLEIIDEEVKTDYIELIKYDNELEKLFKREV